MVFAIRTLASSHLGSNQKAEKRGEKPLLREHFHETP